MTSGPSNSRVDDERDGSDRMRRLIEEKIENLRPECIDLILAEYVEVVIVVDSGVSLGQGETMVCGKMED